MILTRHGAAVLTALLSAGIGAIDARAGGIAGESFTWQYYGGGGALANDGEGSNTGGSFTGGSGVCANTGASGCLFVEPSDQGDFSVFQVDSTDTSIIFDYSPFESGISSWSSSSPLSLASQGGESIPIYNGVAVDLTSGDSITGVTIDSSTNMSGFTSADVGFTNNQIEVDWSGLSFTSDTQVVLDVTVSDESAGGAPEPGTAATFGFGLAAILFLARRRFRAA